MNYKGRVPEKICALSGIVRNKGGGAWPIFFLPFITNCIFLSIKRFYFFKNATVLNVDLFSVFFGKLIFQVTLGIWSLPGGGIWAMLEGNIIFFPHVTYLCKHILSKALRLVSFECKWSFCMLIYILYHFSPGKISNPLYFQNRCSW